MITLNYQSSFSQGINHWETLIDASDTWKYIIPTQELEANWTNSDYNDTSWLSGSGGIGYGDTDDKTIIAANTLSVFLRKTFYLNQASALDSAILYVDYDDGFVAYLNGIEIARANIGNPGDRPPFNATAINIVEPKSISRGNPTIFPINRSKLILARRDGNNTLSLQVHNQAKTSSDLSSTCFFFGGFTSKSNEFRIPPSWFAFASHLPLIIINTNGQLILDEPKINAWIKVINNGPGQINSSNNPATDFEGFIGIEIRGQSSQMFPKQGFGIETRNLLKADSSVSLLGMPEENDWILSAPYSDKSLMRNPLTYYLGSKMGDWQPKTKWCEVFINENYQGIYLLEEKIKRDKDRVNIGKMFPESLTGDSITGGYIVKVDKLTYLDINEYFRTYPTVRFNNARNYDFTYVYPKANVITSAQRIYIKNFLTDLESTLNGSKFKDPLIGYRKYMDENSFAEFQIMQELSNNVDGYRYSTFFYKDRDSDGGKLHAGPLWDFDLCYGNVDYSPPRLATNQWLYTTFGPNEGYGMHWWARLMQDPEYVKMIKLKYSQLRAGAFNTDSIMSYLNNNQTLLGEAINRNFEYWPILNEYIWPNAYIGYTYENELNYLKTWLYERLIWLDSKWLLSLNSENSNALVKDFVVYPNPFSSELNFSILPNNLDEIVVEIYSSQGKRMLHKTIQPVNKTFTDIQIDNINLPSGIYIIQVQQLGQIIGYSKIICSSNK